MQSGLLPLQTRGPPSTRAHKLAHSCPGVLQGHEHCQVQAFHAHRRDRTRVAARLRPLPRKNSLQRITMTRIRCKVHQDQVRCQRTHIQTSPPHPHRQHGTRRHAKPGNSLMHVVRRGIHRSFPHIPVPLRQDHSGRRLTRPTPTPPTVLTTHPKPVTPPRHGSRDRHTRELAEGDRHRQPHVVPVAGDQVRPDRHHHGQRRDPAKVC